MKYYAKTMFALLTGIVAVSSCTQEIQPVQPAPRNQTIRNSVVKIYVTIQDEDYQMPWQGGRMASGTGTGFIIEKRRILTNAHIVSNARFIQVQKDGDAARYKAHVTFVGHDCDLATLEVDDPAFYTGTAPVDFARTIPSLNDEVTVLGYPLGGDRLSITRGVVSRIDFSTFSHSGIDQHLVLQVDAAINPGNSGGPVLFSGKVVGLAFQSYSAAENIGYAIPLPVIDHFLTDIADGQYNGYPELGAWFVETHNPALRKDLLMSDTMTGVAIYYVDPFGAAMNVLSNRDVLTKIDGHRIDNEGNIQLGDNSVIFAELLERKQWGEAVQFEVWRGGSLTNIVVPLKNPNDPFVYRNLYDQRPRYYLSGGLVFSPLTREYLKTVHAGKLSMNRLQLFYFSEYAKIDSFYQDRDEFVVLTRRLPHPVNTYSETFLNGIVVEVNGLKIRKLADVKTAMSSPTNGFHVFTFAGIDEQLIMESDALKQADADIAASYNIPSSMNLGE